MADTVIGVRDISAVAAVAKAATRARLKAIFGWWELEVVRCALVECWEAETKGLGILYLYES